MTPYAFCIASDGNSLFLFDSYSHGTNGVLLVAITLTLGAEYLHFFFSHYYVHLCFNEEDGADKAGHFTILAV